MDRFFLLSKLNEYSGYLSQEERSRNTITKYIRDIKAFLGFADGEIQKEQVIKWKDHLSKRYAPASVNSMLAAVNGFFDWLELHQLKVKPLKVQRSIFASPEKELSLDEYNRLVDAAQHKGNQRLALILQTICATGIRVSELQFVTVESLRLGRTAVENKGKSRTVFLPSILCKCLKKYCCQQRIKGGVVFQTKNGKPLDRSNIWRDMKRLCKSANVDMEKVFPHNLRHLFARTYYSLEKDLSRLADILGHSNISTTRIYTMETGMEHIRQLERMRLVVG